MDVAKHVIVSIPDTKHESDEATCVGIDDQLSDSVSLTQISAPVVHQIFTMLRELPKQRVADGIEQLHKQLAIQIEALLEAQGDTLAVAGLSTHVKNATKAREDDINTSIAFLRQQIQVYADVVVPDKNHADLDAERVAAEALHLSWRKRVDKKTVAVNNNVNLLTSIENAIDALRAQAISINDEHSKHVDAWKVNNEANDNKHRVKIVALLEQVSLKSSSPIVALDTSGDDMMGTATIVTSLQAQVAQLLAQLVTLGVEPVTTVTTDIDAVSLAPTPTTVDDASTVVPGIEEAFANPPPPMAEAEKKARLQRAADSVTVDSAVDGEAAKGKGKGADHY
jgi:hypothetical protein